MYRILYLIVIFLLVLLIRKICKEWNMRKEFKNVQSYIDEFNFAYRQCEPIIASNVEFSESEDDSIKDELNENGEFEIELFEDTYYVTENSREVRKFLMGMGKNILLCEDELVARYGEITYNNSYRIFRENYQNVRNQAFVFGEELN